MLMRRFLICLASIIAMTGWAHAFTFPSIDGGDLDLEDWKGKPVLVVNTASMCAFTRQYDGLQALYDRYRTQGLVVLAVPSGDFRQELATGDQVKEFCAVNFNLDLPMTMIQPVRGSQAHPFYQWVKRETGFEPRWNFNKVLLDADGDVVETYGASVKPQSSQITRQIDRILAGS